MKILILDDKVTFNKSLEVTFEPHNLMFEGKYKFRETNEFFEQYDYVFYRNYLDLLNQLAAARARAAGCRVVFVSDGVFEWANVHRHGPQPLFAPLIATDCFVTSQFDASFIDFHNPDLKGRCIKYTPRNAIFQPTRQDLTKDYDFLVTTANTPYFDDAEFERLSKLLEQVITAIESAGFSCAFRIYDEKLAKTLSLNQNKNFLDESFSDVLLRVHSVISTPSTIAVTAMAAGLPVGLLRYRDAPITLSTGWNIFIDQNLHETLRGMSNLDQERMNFQYIQVSSPSNQDTPNINEAILALEKFVVNPEKMEIEKLLDPRYFSIKLLFLKYLKKIIFRDYGERK